MAIVRNPHPYLHEFLFNHSLPVQTAVPQFIPVLKELYTSLYLEAAKQHPGQLKQLLLEGKQHLSLAKSISTAFEEPFEFAEIHDAHVMTLIFLEEFVKDLCCNVEMKWQCYEQMRGDDNESESVDSDQDFTDEIELP